MSLHLRKKMYKGYTGVNPIRRICYYKNNLKFLKKPFTALSKPDVMWDRFVISNQ